MLLGGGEQGMDIGRGIGGDDLRTAADGFRYCTGEAFPARRQKDDIGITEQTGKFVRVIDKSEEIDPIRDAQFFALLLELSAQRTLAGYLHSPVDIVQARKRGQRDALILLRR